MAIIWKDGSILWRNGAIAQSTACCCDGGGGTAVDCPNPSGDSEVGCCNDFANAGEYDTWKAATDIDATLPSTFAGTCGTSGCFNGMTFSIPHLSSSTWQLTGGTCGTWTYNMLFVIDCYSDQCSYFVRLTIGNTAFPATSNVYEWEDSLTDKIACQTLSLTLPMTVKTEGFSGSVCRLDGTPSIFVTPH